MSNTLRSLCQLPITIKIGVQMNGSKVSKIAVVVLTLALLHASSNQSAYSQQSPNDPFRKVIFPPVDPKFESEKGLSGDIPAEKLGIIASLKLDKQVYKVGDVIIPQVSIDNPTEHTLIFFMGCRGDILTPTPILYLFVRDGLGELVPFQKEVQVERTRGIIVDNRPYATVACQDLRTDKLPALSSDSFSLPNINETYQITKPGIYQITYSKRYYVQGSKEQGVLLSASATITVK
jgi:hypothetical protein